VKGDFDARGASLIGVAVRRARAELKKRLSEGHYRLVEIFDEAEDPNSDPILRGLRVSWFLRSIPGFGEVKARRLLDELGINPAATLGGLRIRQRGMLRVAVQSLYRKYFPHKRGVLVILAGPSGVGKGTVVRWITSEFDDFVASVSATTRPQRKGEKEGEHYFFVSNSRFENFIEEGELLEWAVVHGEHRYGTPLGPVNELLDAGKKVILEIDVQGARQVRRVVGRSISIFLAPPSLKELESRLARRNTEEAAERSLRMVSAQKEMKHQVEFDHVLKNYSVEETGRNVVDLVLREEISIGIEERVNVESRRNNRASN